MFDLGEKEDVLFSYAQIESWRMCQSILMISWVRASYGHRYGDDYDILYAKSLIGLKEKILKQHNDIYEDIKKNKPKEIGSFSRDKQLDGMMPDRKFYKNIDDMFQAILNDENIFLPKDMRLTLQKLVDQ